MTNVEEKLKPLKDFPAYLISETGKVYYKTKKEFIKPRITEHGYLTVFINKQKDKKRNYFLHKLVAETFIWNPHNKPYVNHKDGNKQNPRLENLEWCTAKENTHHAMKYGLINHRTNIGSKKKTSVLNEQQVLKIRQLNKNGSTQTELAKRFGVSQPLISQIIRNELWQHVPQF
jgi:hypothetical protein